LDYGWEFNDIGSVSIIIKSNLCFAALGEECARKRKKKLKDKSHNYRTTKIHKKTSPKLIHFSTSQISINLK